MIKNLIIPSWVKVLPLMGAVALSGYLYISNVSLSSSLTASENDLKSLQEDYDLNTLAYTTLLRDFKSQADRVTELFTKNSEIQQTNNELKGELNGYRGREKTLIKKPTLMERRINSGTSEWLRDMESATSHSDSAE